MSALSELLRAAKDAADISYGEIEKRALAAGTPMSHGTANKYVRGEHPPRPDEKVLAAFAQVFPGLTLAQLKRAANIPADLGSYTAPPEANALNRKERAALDTIIKAMAQSKGRTTLVALLPMEDPTDFDEAAALYEQQDAGPPDQEPES